MLRLVLHKQFLRHQCCIRLTERRTVIFTFFHSFISARQQQYQQHPLLERMRKRERTATGQPATCHHHIVTCLNLLKLQHAKETMTIAASSLLRSSKSNDSLRAFYGFILQLKANLSLSEFHAHVVQTTPNPVWVVKVLTSTVEFAIFG